MQKITFFFIILIGALFAYKTYLDFKDLSDLTYQYIPRQFLEDEKYNELKKKIINKPLLLSNDGYFWVLYATQVANDKKWRIRENNFDNSPYGRDVVWHSGYTWFLVSLGKVVSFFSGDDLKKAIEKNAGFSGPLILFLFIFVWTVIIVQRGNYLLGLAFCFFMLFSPGVIHRAVFGFVDHHILHSMFFMSQLLAVLIGGGGYVNQNIFSESDRYSRNIFPLLQYSAARRWFVLAAFFGSLGLWVGATQQAIVIGSLGIGGAVSFLIRHKDLHHNGAIKPELWRLWGLVGALCSLLFYVLEHWPDYVGMRLEVNHPLFAICWLLGGEMICQIGRLINNVNSYRKKIFPKYILSLCVLGLLCFTLLILFGPDDWHNIHNLTMRRLHDTIFEFKTPFGIMKPLEFVIYFGLSPFVIVFSLFIIFNKKVSSLGRMTLLQILSPTLVLFLFFLLQIRWFDLFMAGSIVLTLIVSVVLSRETGFFQRNEKAAFLLLIWIFLGPSLYIYYVKEKNYSVEQSLRQAKMLVRMDNSFVCRELAINLFIQARKEYSKIRFLSSLSYTPVLAYFGVGAGVGSLYWPNTEGVTDNAAFFSDLGSEKAMSIAKERKLTHLITNIGRDEIARLSTWVHYGVRMEEILHRSFAYRLAENPLFASNWLQPLPMVYYNRLKPMEIVIYEIIRERQENTP